MRALKMWGRGKASEWWRWVLDPDNRKSEPSPHPSDRPLQGGTTHFRRGVTDWRHGLLAKTPPERHRNQLKRLIVLLTDENLNSLFAEHHTYKKSFHVLSVPQIYGANLAKYDERKPLGLSPTVEICHPNVRALLCRDQIIFNCSNVLWIMNESRGPWKERPRIFPETNHEKLQTCKF